MLVVARSMVVTRVVPQIAPGTPRRRLVYDITGKLRVVEGGQYSVCMNSHDGSKLWLAKELLIDNDGKHANKEVCAFKTLTSGNHEVEVIGFSDDYALRLELQWAGPDTGMRKQFMNSVGYLDLAPDPEEKAEPEPEPEKVEEAKDGDEADDATEDDKKDKKDKKDKEDADDDKKDKKDKDDADDAKKDKKEHSDNGKHLGQDKDTDDDADDDTKEKKGKKRSMEAPQLVGSYPGRGAELRRGAMEPLGELSSQMQEVTRMLRARQAQVPSHFPLLALPVL
eukprot:3057067-Rhodomonas_salina.12